LILSAFSVIGAASNVEIDKPKELIVLNKLNSFESSFNVTPCLIKLIVTFNGDPINSFIYTLVILVEMVDSSCDNLFFVLSGLVGFLIDYLIYLTCVIRFFAAIRYLSK